MLVSHGESNSDVSWIVQMKHVGTGVMFWWFFSSRQMQQCHGNSCGGSLLFSMSTVIEISRLLWLLNNGSNTIGFCNYLLSNEFIQACC